ncbi:MAG: hypothetical protein Q8Q01_01065 [archaeon]|nr:hypothetical protein [archaeon]
MKAPKVEFSIASINRIFPMIHFFLNPTKKQWDWSNAIYKNYPELKSKLLTVKDKNKRKEIEYHFFLDVFKKEKNELEKSAKRFQKDWDKINDKVMLVLSEVIEQEWPEKDRTIHGRTSLNPICPRYIKQRTFDVFYKCSHARMKAITMHEILHFIYFEKWKKVFPKTKQREFDSPYLVWKLSEMVPGIILNDDKFQKIFKHKHRPYKEYEKLKIEGKPLLSYLQNFYDNRKDFADFLKQSWKFVKKHEKEINSI